MSSLRSRPEVTELKVLIRIEIKSSVFQKFVSKTTLSRDQLLAYYFSKQNSKYSDTREAIPKTLYPLVLKTPIWQSQSLNPELLC